MRTDRVSVTMKRIAVIGTLAAIAIAIWYLRRPTPSRADADHSVTAVAASKSPTSELRRIDRVTKLAPEERSRLAHRIEAAHAERAALRAPKPPSLPQDSIEDHHDGAADDAASDPALGEFKTQFRDAMREVIPHIAKCYETAVPTLASPDITVKAELTLTGDPDIGTIIDTKGLLDDTGKPLPTKFDDCLRTTFMSLGLPPLAEGDTIVVHYPFVFRTQ